MSLVLLALVLTTQAASADPSGEAAKPRISVQSSDVPSLRVQYLNIPWGPNTFSAMESPGDSFYNRRPWPFAQLAAEAPFSLDGTAVPAGRYALVFHPNSPDDKGMSLEVRRVAADFLEAGNVMAPAPEGEAVLRVPVRFETVTDSAPALRIDLRPSPEGASLAIAYGTRRLVKELRR